MRQWCVLCLIMLFTLNILAALPSTGNDIKFVSPFDYGLKEAHTGEERFWALYNTHQVAIKEGKQVDYSGIDTVDIVIPKGASSIPLGVDNDFKGATFNVTNKEKNLFLFEYSNHAFPIAVRNKLHIDKGIFREYPQINKGKYLLCVRDKNPWVETREGYKYGHIREDLLLVENGVAVNQPVMPYNNDNSSPECMYYIVSDSFYLGNLVFNRTESCEYKTFLCRIIGVSGLTIHNINIMTPNNDWGDDQIISLQNCANVTLSHLRIDGTYSRKDYSGYGVHMKNIWHFRADNMYGHANWGIFGNNNINDARISNSDINRFDIHCYGRDISFYNVIFRNRYNQFSSVYGTIKFDSCSFLDFTPVINGPSYNAYVGYDLIFNNCVYSTGHDTPVLIEGGYVDDVVNKRSELSARCLPNVTINNLTFKVSKKAPNVYLFFLKKRGGKMRIMEYMRSIRINGVKIEYKDGAERAPVNFIISNMELEMDNKVRKTFKHIDLLGNAKRKNSNNGKVINCF